MAVTESLKSRMIRSAAWLIGSNVSGQALRLGSNLILTRLLIPADFGIVAAVSTLYLALVLFSDFGIWQSVVKSPEGLKPRYLGTAWTIQLLRAGLLSTIVLVLAGLLAVSDAHSLFEAGSAYTDPRMPALMSVFAISALFQGLESMNLAIAQRELRVDRLARLEIFSQIGGIVITIALAWMTRSVWALAIGNMSSTVLRTSLSHLYLEGPRTRPCWDKTYATELMHFGKWILISSIIGFLAANGERLLLAGFLSATIFGIFSIAATMLSAITSIYSAINGHIVYASISHASRNDSPEAAKRINAKVQLIADVLLGLLAGSLALCGSWMITILYDPRYHDAGWMLQWLAIGVVGLRFQVVEQLMFAHGHPQWVTANNLLRALILAIGIPYGYATNGTTGAIVAVVISQFGSWPLSIYFKYREGLLNGFRELVWIPAMLLGATLGWLMDWLLNTLLN